MAITRQDTIDMLQEKLDMRRKRFLKWLSENPDVWTEFCHLSLMAIQNGRKHYSAWLISARIRCDREIKSSDGDYKISNERIGWLARYFHHKYPQYKGFYETRPLKEEKQIQELLAKPDNVVQLHR